MDGNDINEVSEKVDQAIKCAKKRLSLSGDGLIIQQKQKKTRSSMRIFRKCTEKSGNDKTVLQSQDIYRKRS